MTLLEFLSNPENQSYVVFMTIVLFAGAYALIRAFRR